MESKADSSKGFFHVGEAILEELARVKANITNFNITELMKGWIVIFDKSFKRKIEEYCVVKNPFNTENNIHIKEFEDNNEEVFPIQLEDGNLLNESGSFYENNYLANLSPNRRLSLTKSIAEVHNRNSSRFSLTNSVIS